MQLSLFLVSAVGSLASTLYQGHDVDGYVFTPVQEIYGEVSPPARQAYLSHRKKIFEELREKIIANQKKSRVSAAGWFGNNAGGTAATEYEHLRTPENCVFPIDLLLLQDATGSFQVDFELTVNNTLPAIEKVLPERHPNSRISLVTFKDKPMRDLGESSDYCVKVHALNEESPNALRPHYESTGVGGGYDYPENQYGALVSVLSSPKTIPWSQNPLASKLVIQITDAQPHFGGDAQQFMYPQLAEWGSSYDEDAEAAYCKERYYPSPDTVKDTILSAQSYFASIIVRPEDPIANPLPAWQWFNSYVGFPDTFVQASTDNIEGWFNELLEILEAIEQEECVFDATTTTQPPITEPTPAPESTPEPSTPTTTPKEVEPSVSTTEGENNCVCPPTNPDCCQKAPEVLIALMKRPENLDIHLVGPEIDPSL